MSWYGNSVGTNETASFYYLANQTLLSPFSPAQNFGSTHLLQSSYDALGLAHLFEYGTNGSGELSKVTFPYGVYLRWAYQNFTYLGSRTLREVQYRYLAKSSGATETVYTLGYNPTDTGNTVHSYRTLDGPGGVGEKVWWFITTLGAWQIGLVNAYEDRPAPAQGPALQNLAYTWAQNAAGNPYIASVVKTLDVGTSYQQQSKTEQTLDTNGNVTQTKVYDYGNLSTPARTYNHTYLTNTNYTSRYIFNRLTQSTVTNGSQTGNAGD